MNDNWYVCRSTRQRPLLLTHYVNGPWTVERFNFTGERTKGHLVKLMPSSAGTS